MSGRDRLLIVSGSYPEISCGVSRHVDIIASGTAGTGEYDVHVLTSDDPLIDQGLAKNYTVHAAVRKWDFLHVGPLCRKILSYEPNVVHIQNPSIRYYGWNSILMSVVGPKLKRMAGDVRLVVTQHDIALGRAWLRRRYRPLFKAADAVLVSNERDYQAVRDEGISEEAIHVAPVGSHFDVPERSAERKQRAREEMGIPEEAICIAYFGYIHPGRNIDVLIEALGKLKKQGTDIQAVIMGGAFTGKETYYENCRELANELGLAEAIHWTGYASEDQIITGLAAADVFVSLPGRGADMRNTSIQTAILAELPVVTTRNERHYHDPKLEEMGCVCLREITAEKTAEAIKELIEKPPSPAELSQRRGQLNPEKIWARHIAVSLEAYRKGRG